MSLPYVGGRVMTHKKKRYFIFLWTTVFWKASRKIRHDLKYLNMKSPRELIGIIVKGNYCWCLLILDNFHIIQRIQRCLTLMFSWVDTFKNKCSHPKWGNLRWHLWPISAKSDCDYRVFISTCTFENIENNNINETAEVDTMYTHLLLMGFTECIP